MLGSIFIGLSGMNAFSGGLRQISNNITNINSNGFKAADLAFTDLFGVGARNARTGQGVTLAETRIDFAQGELRQSTRDLDLGIDGTGFLVLLREGQRFFTRGGSFEVAQNGDIVLAGTDYKLAHIGGGHPVALSIEAHRTHAPQATTRLTFADNLSSTTLLHTTPAITVYNAEGASESWQVRFQRETTSPLGEWRVTVLGANGQELASQTLRFIGGIVDPAANTLTIEHGDRNVILDFSRNVTSFSSGDVSSLRIANSDGFGAGELTSLTVDEEGQLVAGYSNEQKHKLGPIALALFDQPQSLEQRDGGLFVLAGRSSLDYLDSTRETVGRVMGRRLEASNVDLSREFGELIMVQRGYQASSQVVSVTNDMIQQLFGIRGQG